MKSIIMFMLRRIEPNILSGIAQETIKMLPTQHVFITVSYAITLLPGHHLRRNPVRKPKTIVNLGK